VDSATAPPLNRHVVGQTRWELKVAQWTKDEAMEELRRVLGEVDTLTRVRRFSAPHTRWLARTLRLLEEVFGASSRYYMSVAALKWSETGSFIVSAWDPTREIERRHQETYVHQLDMARGLLQAALDELESSTIDNVYKGKDTPRETSDILKVLTLVERKLRKVMREVPQREQQVQDAVENLLVGADVDYSRETDAIEYSSKTYTPDFSLPRIDLALEVKLSCRAGREKEIIAEINDDILAYATKYRNIVFLVYDVGFIRDVERFVRHFEQHEGVLVRVVKH
jgi:hypothetical protein